MILRPCRNAHKQGIIEAHRSGRDQTLSASTMVVRVGNNMPKGRADMCVLRGRGTYWPCRLPHLRRRQLATPAGHRGSTCLRSKSVPPKQRDGQALVVHTHTREQTCHNKGRQQGDGGGKKEDSTATLLAAARSARSQHAESARVLIVRCVQKHSASTACNEFTARLLALFS